MHSHIERQSPYELRVSSYNWLIYKMADVWQFLKYLGTSIGFLDSSILPSSIFTITLKARFPMKSQMEGQAPCEFVLIELASIHFHTRPHLQRKITNPELLFFLLLEVLGASGSFWEALGVSGASGSFWEPLGTSPG
jgi:hypothetical protein